MSQSRSKSSRFSRKSDKHAESISISADPLEDDNFLSENASIEADGEFDEIEPDFSALASEIIGSLQHPAFEEDRRFEHSALEEDIGEKLPVVDYARVDEEKTEQSIEQKKRFVIPKLKRPETEALHDISYGSDEGKREWRKLERDPDAGKRNMNSVDRMWDQDRSTGWGGQDHGKSRDQGDRDCGRSRDRGDQDHSRSRDGDRSRRVSRDSRENRGKHFPEKESTSDRQQLSVEYPAHREERQSLFDSFAADGLISAERPLDINFDQPVKEDVMKKSGLDVEMATHQDVYVVEPTEQKSEEEPAPVKHEGLLEIPMGRDSLVFARDYYPWQIRVYPVNRKDMPRADFAQVWALANSSSIVWSDHTNFGGVAEFLLKDDDSIQKFMRKVLWHNFDADCITVEITHRDTSNTTRALVQSNGAGAELDCVISQAVFRFHNTHARRLLKTYYPSPKGEVTERSLYVNNVGTGVSADLMKAIFPCALKISVAKPGKGATSTALVETESEEASFNYLVVYHQIRINGLDLVLSTLHCDWEGAKEKFIAQENKNEITNTTRTATAPAAALKRPNTSIIESGIPRKAIGVSPAAARGRGAYGGGLGGRGGGQTGPLRGRGGLPARGRGARGGAALRGRDHGRPLLPNPVIAGGGGGEGLLPHPEPQLLPPPPPPPPLLASPPKPAPAGLREADYMASHDDDRRTAELKEIQQHLETKVLETRASLMRAARMAEAQVAEGGELFDYAHRPGMPARPHRPVDYGDERPRDPPRRTLLPLDGPPHMEPEKREEQPNYHRPRPPPAREPGPPRNRGRGLREEDHGDQRSSGHPRRYLLEAPPPEKGLLPEEDSYTGAPVYNYDHAPSRSRMEPDMHQEERPPLIRHAPGDRNRPAYSEKERRPSRGHEAFDYEDHEARRPGYAGGYEEEDRPRGQPTPRFREDYDGHY